MIFKRIIAAFGCLVLLGSSALTVTAPVYEDVLPDETLAPLIQDFPHEIKRKPRIPQVDPKPQVVVKSKPTSKPTVNKTRHSIAGQASWYCKTGVSICTRNHPGGFYAAIRRDLLFLRGKRIKVCDSNNCITVTIIDCNCGPRANLIDLYSDAYRRLAPLSTGRINVVIKW